ncbi:MAG: PIN domain-containing protein [Actinomycetia bacterium]|nr:PIN domain-containing protein [Actinomycetes bacterium]
MFSASLRQVSSELTDLYRSDVRDVRLIISFQTAAEIRYGAAKAGWGQPRIEAMNRKLAVAVTVPPWDELVKEWARLRVECQRTGHAFHAKRHAADLWVAATATLLSLPLVTHDAGFRGVPGLDVICHV